MCYCCFVNLNLKNTGLCNRTTNDLDVVKFPFFPWRIVNFKYHSSNL